MPLPVTIVTGFLGSGKTTLLRHLLRDPTFADAAVVINEFGEIGLDHLLVEKSDDTVVQIAGGCLCCAVRGDLVRTLAALLHRRDDGAVRAFDRIVIETSGLADPAPVAHSIMGDSELARRLRLAGIVTVVDAVNALETMRAHPQALRQVAVADRLVVSKADLAPDATAGVCAELHALNPTAEVRRVEFGMVDAKWLDGVGRQAAREVTSAAGRLPRDTVHLHESGIVTHAVVREEPFTRLELARFLGWLASRAGPDLLRVKGLVTLAEEPAGPAVIHAVQHVLHPPEWLDGWPDGDRRSRLVIIARGVPRSEIDAVLRAAHDNDRNVLEEIHARSAG